MSKVNKKLTTVREHPMRVPVSKKNPTGKTIRDRHVRRLKGTYLDVDEITSILNRYDLKAAVFPTAKKLEDFKGVADKFDKIIAVWADFFNKKFKTNPPLDPDVVKALIASESSFNPDPKGNRAIALGIAQITKSTLKILQDPNGEAKDFIFKDIRQKDLKDPNVNIAMATRWLFRKRVTATNRLGRVPNHEELILEYKGLLKSNSKYKASALENYREVYEKLKH